MSWPRAIPLFTLLAFVLQPATASAFASAHPEARISAGPVTHQRRGHQVEALDSSGGVHWDRDPRGLVAAETYVHGATTTRRDYTYDGHGELTRATTGTDVASYAYTDVVYAWDAAGRVVGKGEWAFDYGANGQLTHASRPGRQLDFVYDDGNQRLLKRIDGVPVRADVAGGVLTENHFIELVTIAGIVAGVLDNGHFTALLTDARGTPFAGPDGTPGLASPYGVRVSHLALAEVIDYARLGWDADLDVVRMGVRDYDAKLSQFLTPDPLYFEDLGKCQASPLQCSLYGYAAGNPVSFVDPTGLGFWSDLLADALEATATVGGGIVGFMAAGPGGAVLGAGLARGLASAPSDLIRGETPTVQRQLKAVADGSTAEMGGLVVGKVVIAPVAKAISSRLSGRASAQRCPPASQVASPLLTRHPDSAS